MRWPVATRRRILGTIALVFACVFAADFLVRDFVRVRFREAIDEINVENFVQARRLLEPLAELGHSPSQHFLGLLCVGGIAGPDCVKDGKEYLRRSNESPFPYGATYEDSLRKLLEYSRTWPIRPETARLICAELVERQPDAACKARW